MPAAGARTPWSVGAPGAETPARAARRTFAVTATIGVLVGLSILLVLARLAASWRVGSGHTAAVSVLGQRVSYPTANAGAILIAVLAGVGLAVLVAGAVSAARELFAQRRLRRALTARGRSQLDGGAWIVETNRPQAFCAGLLNPRVYVSHSVVEMLSEPELAAIVAHERHHMRCRDPLRLVVGRVLADALFFVPPLRGLVERQESVGEIAADVAAVAGAGGDSAPLASAILRFSESSDAEAAGIAPERIDYLVGERRGWPVPVALCAVIATCLAALIALVSFAAKTASGKATLALPVVSSEPCIVVLAVIPAVAVFAGVVYARERGRMRAHRRASHAGNR
jgi:Zn-dependent protease with chaperone function